MSTDVSLHLLSRVRIGSPCDVRWEQMTGDDRVRHCAQCDLKVYNFSAMAGDEVEALLRSHVAPGGARVGERLCANWRRRRDGTMIVGDCPVGAAKARARVVGVFARVAAAIGLASLIPACGSSDMGGRVAVPQDDEAVVTTGGEGTVESAAGDRTDAPTKPGP
jgi:hypothetical protein